MSAQFPKMRVLVACEFSGRVREAFAALGHDAWSCDLLPTEIPGQHIQGDVLEILNDGWDLMIAHPPCQYLSFAALRVWNAPGRAEKRAEAMEFFLRLWNAPIPKICIENPKGEPCKHIPPTQMIHPYYFGNQCMKRTLLWLKGIPPLYHPSPHLLNKPLSMGKNPNGKERSWTEVITGKNRAYERSRTFPGIAQAMAEQWGKPQAQGVLL